MRYPARYLYLIDLFLEKRDPHRGGVEGFKSKFKFDLHEAYKFHFDNSWKEVREALHIMKQDEVMTKWSRKGNTITVQGCTTDNLKQYRERIKNSTTGSSLCIETPNGKMGVYVRYGSKVTEHALTKCVLAAFTILNKNFGGTVPYQDFVNAFIRNSDCHIIQGVREENEKIKKVQNVVGMLRERLEEIGFPKDGIENTTREGYHLTM